MKKLIPVASVLVMAALSMPVTGCIGLSYLPCYEETIRIENRAPGFDKEFSEVQAEHSKQMKVLSEKFSSPSFAKLPAAKQNEIMAKFKQIGSEVDAAIASLDESHPNLDSLENALEALKKQVKSTDQLILDIDAATKANDDAVLAMATRQLSPEAQKKLADVTKKMENMQEAVPQKLASLSNAKIPDDKKLEIAAKVMARGEEMQNKINALQPEFLEIGSDDSQKSIDLLDKLLKELENADKDIDQMLRDGISAATAN